MSAELRAKLEALADKWQAERGEYPIETDRDAFVAEIAVRVCERELRAVILGRTL